MATYEEIKRYAKTLYRENKLRSYALYCAALLSLEYLDKLKPERQSLYIPDLASSLENQLNIVLPNFFREDELWLDSSRFILNYLECWYTDPKFTKAAMKEFQIPLCHTQVNSIKTFQQAEDFMINVAAYNTPDKI